MRLISCYIENYGKISKTEYVFDKGITQFCEENGFGKTTLASFLKAMFYGLPSFTTRTKAFDDRQHFYPFSGGKFGGNVRFEMHGQEYRIERFFDKKSDTKDEVRVFVGGTLTEELGEDIGKSVFGLDEASFERTVFFSADDTEIMSTGGIHAKLNRFVDATEDGMDFEAAIERLEKAKKRLKAAKGNNDLSSKQKEKIFALQTEIENLEKIENSLEGLYREREQLSKTIAALDLQTTKVYQDNLVLQKFETYEGMLEALAEDKKTWTALRDKYPRGLPNQEEITRLRARFENGITLKSKFDALTLDAEKNQRITSLKRMFANGAPTEQTLSALQQNVTRVGTLYVEEKGLESALQEGQNVAMEEKFRRCMPQAQEVERVRGLVERYKQADRKLQAAVTVAGATTGGARTAKPFWVLVLLGVLTVILGGAFIFTQKLLGGVLIAAGAATLAAGIVWSYKAPKGEKRALHLGDDTIRAQEEKTVSERAIIEFLVPYGYYSQSGVVYDFASFERDLAAYQSAQESAASTQRLLGQKQEERHTLERELEAEFSKYGVEGESWQLRFNALVKAFGEYDTLVKEQTLTATTKANYARQIEQNGEEILSILKKYGIAVEGELSILLQNLQRDKAEFLRVEKSLETGEDRAAKYRAQNALNVKPVIEKQDAQALQTQLSQARRALALLDRQIADAEGQTERLSDKQNELLLAEERLEEYRKKYGLYRDAIAALTAAEQKLKDKYVAPIKQSFCQYAQVLERELGERMSMDKDFKISFERGGENRSDRHLSAGQKHICALCFRLALIDNMYEKEQPFLIMDDPFVHLDEGHLKSVLSILQSLAREKQIIYFCCHESRSF